MDEYNIVQKETVMSRGAFKVPAFFVVKYIIFFFFLPPIPAHKGPETDSKTQNTIKPPTLVLGLPVTST